MKLDLKSSLYEIKSLTDIDIPELYEFCKANTKYYEYMKMQPTQENLRECLTELPPGCTPENKHFVGCYWNEKLVAVLDLITGYPNPETAYIGCFMVKKQMQGTGIGKQLMEELFALLRQNGFTYAELGCIKDNKEALAFWTRNGFISTGSEVDAGDYWIVCMKKDLMIREAQSGDLDRLMQLWLTTNLEAHSFVPADYWTGNFEAVAGMLPEAMIYVYEDSDGIQGFVGLMENYIAGIFVSSAAQSMGIGKRLLERAKEGREELSLHVYQKNARAVDFYRREGFVVECEGMDEENGEADFCMSWSRK